MGEFRPCLPPEGTPSPSYCWLLRDNFTLDAAELFCIAAWNEGRWLFIENCKSYSLEEVAKLRLTFRSVIPFPGQEVA